MNDLKKIIILSDDYGSQDKEELNTVIMKTEGMRVVALYWINDVSSITSDSLDDLINELKNELYSDSYEEDDLTIGAIEAVCGEQALQFTAEFIDMIWDEDCMVYYYNSNDEQFSLLAKFLTQLNGSIYLGHYHEIFTDGENTDRDIFTIMKEVGLKTENLLKDSKISLIYFLHGLIERLFNR